MAGGKALMQIAVLTARLVVGGAFVYAGWLKGLNVEQFIRDIWNFRVLPEEWAYWVAAYLPFLEVAAGLALITGIHRRGAHVVLLGLLVAFLALLGSAWARGLEVNCGCFGATPADNSLGWPVARDVLLLAGVLVSMWANRTARPALTGSLPKTP